ncbi:MAG TPA: hypothetical protein VNP97_07755 [Microbacterium sp.]|nr:hypothetical protein [Microbacterium sp.]
MSGEPGGDAAHVERGELDALRRRAYAPDADIWDDAVAIARLSELENRLRRERDPALREAPHSSADDGDEEIDAPPFRRPATSAPSPAPSAEITPPAAAPSLRRPRHTALVGVIAVIAGLFGGIAWSQAQSATTTPSAYAKTVAVANDRRAAGYEIGYDLYMDGLRDDLLALVRGSGLADRMIRDQLTPYGILFGRTVGAGPTIDHEFCMIIADLPETSITCIPVENAYANPVSVVLPAWYTEPNSDLFTGLGAPVSFTLMPGGSVVAVPADRAESLAPIDSAATVATAAPPGWQ